MRVPHRAKYKIPLSETRSLNALRPHAPLLLTRKSCSAPRKSGCGRISHENKCNSFSEAEEEEEEGFLFLKSSPRQGFSVRIPGEISAAVVIVAFVEKELERRGPQCH